MPSASASQTLFDERGFAFVLPRLGLPENGGEFVAVKAAIGRKQDVLDRLVHDKSVQLPLPPRVRGDDSAVVPLRHQGALWVLNLHKPASSLPAASPEFFYTTARRFLPDALKGSKDLPELADGCVWVMWPMAAYEDQMSAAATAAPRSTLPLTSLNFDAGTASQTKVEPEKALSEREIRNGVSIFRDAWCKQVYVDKMRAAEQRGESANLDPTGLAFRVRPHPAKDDEFTSLDYVALNKADAQADISEDQWLPVPPHATKPEALRRCVNLNRKLFGKAPFSKKQWPPTPTDLA